MVGYDLKDGSSNSSKHSAEQDRPFETHAIVTRERLALKHIVLIVDGSESFDTRPLCATTSR
jgi:hypothetical protein